MIKKNADRGIIRCLFLGKYRTTSLTSTPDFQPKITSIMSAFDIHWLDNSGSEQHTQLLPWRLSAPFENWMKRWNIHDRMIDSEHCVVQSAFSHWQNIRGRKWTRKWPVLCLRGISKYLKLTFQRIATWKSSASRRMK